ncbi:MAG: lactonase family protein [Chitinophagaceae bacterium]|nr:lactonase family protein [Chitinophagaceae bacterium]
MRLLVTILFLLLAGGLFAQEFFLFTGTYTSGGSKGIYVYSFNSGTGEFTPVSIAEGVSNPSFLSLSPSGKYLYAVNQNSGGALSEVSAFSFDRATGQLTFINKQPSGGEGPCYISTDATGKWIMVGHYTGGTLTAFQVEKNGGLKSQGQLIAHSGSGVNKQRQEKAHVHAAVFSPDQRLLLVPDLGIDKVMIYRFDPVFWKKPLTPAKKQSFVSTKPGSGPRHLTFHPTLPYAYLIEELQGTISVFQYSQDTFKLLQNISSHPPDYTGAKGSADIHVSPDGKFLYASNRGDAHNLAIFSVNNDNGKLAAKGFQSTMGTVPRNFTIDPTGNYLLVANQQSSNIVIFKRDKLTGQLTATGKEISVPNPVCLVMLKK